MTEGNAGRARTAVGPVLIVGAGGFGREVRDLVEQAGGHVLGFLDDDPSPPVALHAPLLGAVDHAADLDVPFLCAIGAPSVRRRVLAKLEAIGRPAAPALVHPTVVIGSRVELAPGAIVTAGCVLTTDITIGAHVILNLGCTVGHDATIGAGSALMPGVHVSGGAHLGREVFVGTNAAILEGVNVGDGATIGAGAVVTRDVEPGTLVVGVPARPVVRA